MRIASPYLAVALLSMAFLDKAIAQLRIFSPASVDDLVDAIASKSVKIVDSDTSHSAKLFLEDPHQAGVFRSASNGDQDIGLGSFGIVLSSAFAENAEEEENGRSSSSDELEGPGSPALDSLLASARGFRGEGIPQLTQDACVLRFRFKCEPPPNSAPSSYNVTFDYVFGSDNYPTDGDEFREDLMGAFLNGNNIARVGEKRTYVSVNTVHKGPLYRNNPQRRNKGGPRYRTSMRGFTAVLRARGQVKAGRVHELVLAVADGSGPGRGRNGRKNGAWLFVRGGSLRCIPRTTRQTLPRPPPPSSQPSATDDSISSSPSPSLSPTPAPSTAAPTPLPGSSAPSLVPTEAPGEGDTKTPSIEPARSPTVAPTGAPTRAPTGAPRRAPTGAPVVRPTLAPASAPVQVPAPTSPPSNSGGTLTCTFDPSDSVSIVLAFDPAGKTLAVEVTYQGVGWVGFGVSPDEGMVGSEVVIAKPDEDQGPANPGKYVIFGKSESRIELSSRQTLTEASFEQTGGVTVLRFTKALVEEGEVAIQESNNTFVYAVGLSNGFGPAPHKERGLLRVPSFRECSAQA